MFHPISSRFTMRLVGISVILAVAALCARRSAHAADPAPAAAPAAAAQADDHSSSIDAKALSAILGVNGDLKNSIYHVTVPREDLSVSVEGMFVPVDAGLASVFHFWVCSCGKTVVYGEFCLADYEVNDVVDALRAGGVRVTSVSNLLIGEQPKLMGVRFYAEGDGPELAKAIKAALNNTGEARNAKQPLK
jgi:hypothetical protein